MILRMEIVDAEGNSVEPKKVVSMPLAMLYSEGREMQGELLQFSFETLIREREMSKKAQEEK